MELSSALELQAELRTELAEIGLAPGARKHPIPHEGALAGRGGRVLVAYSATRTATIDPVQRTMALGIAPYSAKDYRIAVRVQRRALMDSPQLDHIRSRARGEVDVLYVGRLTMLGSTWQRERVRPLRIPAGSATAVTAGRSSIHPATTWPSGCCSPEARSVAPIMQM